MSLARLRLVMLVVVLTGGLVVFAATDVVDLEAVRRWVLAAGPLAPLAYVVTCALLGAALVPGPALAAVGGLLFGAVVGTAATLASGVLSAVVALRIGRRLGRDGVHELAGERAEAVERGLLRFGLAGVVGQRLMPGVPDAPASYLAGALGLRSWQIALGTAIGALPRTFAYTAIGASLDDPRSPLALAGIATWVLTGLLGLELARRGLVTVRARRRPAAGAGKNPR